MITLRLLLITLVLFVLITLYSLHSEAQNSLHPKVAIKTRAWQGNGAKPQQIDVISTHDNRDGTVSIFLIACGSMIEVKADREALMKQDEEITTAATKAAKTACGD